MSVLTGLLCSILCLAFGGFGVIIWIGGRTRGR